MITTPMRGPPLSAQGALAIEGEAPANTRPDGRPAFLVDYVPAPGLRRLSPISRVPAVDHLAAAWHVAAERNPSQLMVLDRAPDIDPRAPTTWTFADWAGLVDAAAAWLHAGGVRAWDRVAIFKSNHVDVAVLSVAAARLGAIPAQLAWTHSRETACTLLARLERPTLVTDAGRLAMLNLDAAERRTLVERTIVIDGTSDTVDAVPLDDLRGGGPAPFAPRRRDEPTLITHTSGTTGIPKLVMYSPTALHARSHLECERWPLVGLRERDAWAFGSPYFHVRTATALHAIATATPKMLWISSVDERSVGELLTAHRATIVEFLPNAYLALEHLARDRRDLFSTVRLYVNSFDAIHARTMRAFLGASGRRLPIWAQDWAQSEVGAIVVRPYVRAVLRRRGRRRPATQHVGWPVPLLCKLRTVDPVSGERVKRGEVGLIEVAHPGRCVAYVGEQHRHELKSRGVWWNTGDLGTIGRLGDLRLVDREVDRLGEGSCIELEDVLLDRLPQTTEIIVLGLPGSEPAPVFSTVADRELDAGAWSAATADLPALRPPIHIRWQDFPRTATLKVRRVELRERLFRGAEPLGVGRWT